MQHRISNPRALTDLWKGNEIGDPFLMRFNGIYYLYCSSHGIGHGIKCWTSPDMVSFTYAGYVCTDERIYGAYAPEVCYNRGWFYMVTSPVGSGHYLLRAKEPVGPFEIISPNYGLAIDGSLFVDDDGQTYFYRASSQGIRVHTLCGAEEILPQSHPIQASYLGHWTEGPMVVKHDGRYFLTDTGNHVLSKGYRVEYSVSREGPDRGFRKMKDPILLLETRDEYHALGHSSTCLGPDMDTYYIVYHKNILDDRNRPMYRSLNMDRMFFNGDRLYTNATWWPQAQPEQPSCLARGREELVPHPLGYALAMETEAVYTAEINLTIKKDSGMVFFSCRDAQAGTLTLQSNGQWLCSLPEGERAGKLPVAVDASSLMTVRVSQSHGKLILFVNGLEILRTDTALAGGALGLDGNSVPGFIAFSQNSQDSSQRIAEKAVPGTWDAVHCLEQPETVPGETGCLAARVNAGEALTFPISVCHAGEYYLQLRLRGSKNNLTVCVNGQTMSAPPNGAWDTEGQENRFMGRVTLPKGSGELTISFATEAEVDRVSLLEADAFSSAVLIEKGNDVTAGGLKVIGHKQHKSMLTKFSGYTCAEGYGEGYFGGNWRDYQVRAVLNMTPCAPGTCACIYLRSRLESWHPAQIAAARLAYCVRVLPDRIELMKQSYDEKLLAACTLSLAYPSTLTLLCRVVGNCIQVYRQTDAGRELLLHAADPLALPCGHVGLDAHEDGMGFERFCVEEIDD